MRLLIGLVLVSGVLFLASGCAENAQNQKKAQESAGSQPSLAWRWFWFGPPDLKLVDEQGQPLPNANVYFDSDLGHGAKSNDQGLVSLETLPADFSLTVEKEGMMRTTFMHLNPKNQTLTIKKSTSNSWTQVKGNTSNFGNLPTDGTADFAIVMPALKHQRIIDFDIRQYVSADVDEISIYGTKAKIPSNVDIPKQRENYILPVTLDKDFWHLNLNMVGPQRMFALRGQFPFSPFVDQMRQKRPFYELVNYFNFVGGGLREVNLQGGEVNLKIPVNEIQFGRSFTAVSPVLPPNQYIFTIAANKINDDYFISDIKKLESQQSTKLKLMTSSKPFLITVAVPKNIKLEPKTPYSLALSNFQDGTAPQQLPLAEPPSYAKSNELDLVIPTQNDFEQTGLYLFLSQTNPEGVKTKLWEVYSPSWDKKIQLPDLPLLPTMPDIEGQTFTWDIFFYASNRTLTLGPDMSEYVTHASHVSVDLR